MSGRRSGGLVGAVRKALLGLVTWTLLHPYAGSAAEAPSIARRPQIRLQAVVEPAETVVGGQLLYTLYLYTQTDVSSIQADRLPDFRQFWVYEIPQPEQLRPEIAELDGVRYGRVVILQRAIFALRPGRFELTAASTFLQRQVPVVHRDQHLGSRTEELRLEGNPVTVVAHPLPPAPPEFEGAVGSLEIEQSLSEPTIPAGGASVWTVTVRGSGRLGGLPLPVPSQVVGIDLPEPDVQTRHWLEADRVVGERRWRFVLSPARPGTLELPTASMPFFAPTEGRYRVATAAGPRLETTADRERTSGETSLSPRAVRLIGAGTLGGLTAFAWLFVRFVRPLSRDRRILGSIAAVDLAQPARRIAARVEEICSQFLAARWAPFAGSASSEWPELGRRLGLRSQSIEALGDLAGEIAYLRSAPELASAEILRERLVEATRRLLSRLRGEGGGAFG